MNSMGLLKMNVKKTLCPLSMLLDDLSIENQGFSQETLTMSKLAMYNFGNRKIVADRKYSNKRHPRHLETPLTTYISLKIYANVSSKDSGRFSLFLMHLFALFTCFRDNKRHWYKNIKEIRNK